MHRSTHVRIAREIAFNIQRPDLSPRMEIYSVKPDEWKDYPHHTMGRNSARIIRRVRRARENFIHGNDAKAAAELGIAFHYLADEHVLFRGSNIKHSLYESKITSARLYTQFADGLEGKNTTLNYIYNKMSELSSRRYVLAPEDALNSSYRVCLSVAKSVFGSKSSLDIESILTKLEKLYLERMRGREEEFVLKLFENEKKDKAFALSVGVRRIRRRFVRFFTLFNFRFNRNIKCYKEKRHFTGLVRSYYREASESSLPYQDWYKVEIPQLSILTKEVKPLLLSIDSAVIEFKLSVEKIKELQETMQLSTVKLKGKEFIKGEDIEKITNHLSPPIEVNGGTIYLKEDSPFVYKTISPFILRNRLIVKKVNNKWALYLNNGFLTDDVQEENGVPVKAIWTVRDLIDPDDWKKIDDFRNPLYVETVRRVITLKVQKNALQDHFSRSRKKTLEVKRSQSHTKKRTTVNIEAKCRKCGQTYSLEEYLENKYCRKCKTFLALERTAIEETKT